MWLQLRRRALPDARPQPAAHHQRPGGFPKPDRRPCCHVHLERAGGPERRLLVPLREFLSLKSREPLFGVSKVWKCLIPV